MRRVCRKCIDLNCSADYRYSRYVREFVRFRDGALVTAAKSYAAHVNEGRISMPRLKLISMPLPDRQKAKLLSLFRHAWYSKAILVVVSYALCTDVSANVTASCCRARDYNKSSQILRILIWDFAPIVFSTRTHFESERPRFPLCAHLFTRNPSIKRREVLYIRLYMNKYKYKIYRVSDKSLCNRNVCR